MLQWNDWRKFKRCILFGYDFMVLLLTPSVVVIVGALYMNARNVVALGNADSSSTWCFNICFNETMDISWNVVSCLVMIIWYFYWRNLSVWMWLYCYMNTRNVVALGNVASACSWCFNICFNETIDVSLSVVSCLVMILWLFYWLPSFVSLVVATVITVTIGTKRALVLYLCDR
jgi:hypothetical protein